MAQVISFVQEKGGAGKSTLLCGLASLLSDENQKLAIIDTDTQRTASVWAESQGDKVDYLEIFQDGDLNPAVRQMKQDYDFIFIDTAGYKSSIATFAMGMSDLVLIPSKASGPDAQGAINTFSFLETIRDNLGKDIPAYVVMTDVDKGTTMTREVRQALSAIDGLTILDGVCWHRTALKQMITDGTPPSGTAREALYEVLNALKSAAALDLKQGA